MQLYKTTATDGHIDSLPRYSWQGSADAASKARTALKKDGMRATSEFTNVPTDKAGLLDWLNENATH